MKELAGVAFLIVTIVIAILLRNMLTGMEHEAMRTTFRYTLILSVIDLFLFLHIFGLLPKLHRSPQES